MYHFRMYKKIAKCWGSPPLFHPKPWTLPVGNPKLRHCVIWQNCFLTDNDEIELKKSVMASF